MLHALYEHLKMANFFMDDLNPFKDSYNFMDVPLDYPADGHVTHSLHW
jgi:hypothetical protein